MKYQIQNTLKEDVATFGAGCYWGTEHLFVNKFQKQFGNCLLGYAVGFMSPIGTDEPVKNPTYNDVCGKDTSYVEVLRLRYDTTMISYEQLVRFFFTIHDSTLDKRAQYSSVVFFHSKEQQYTAMQVRNQVQELINEEVLKSFKHSEIRTSVTRAKKFYPAHLKHQEFMEKNPNAFCSHRIMFNWDKALAVQAACKAAQEKEQSSRFKKCKSQPPVTLKCN